MRSVPKISNSEWHIMRVLWESSPLTANQVVESMSDETKWKSRTVKTLINRLVKKGALSYEADGRTYLYSPKVNEEDCVRAESSSFLRRTFAGALVPMLVHFIEDRSLSNKEIDELTEILEQKRKG
ncbi:MAG: BlaI/MecI/CopY family transcriptional regulator [Candidatus Hydrogenedentota bacterium]